MKTKENKTIHELSQQDQSPYPILSPHGRKGQSGSPFTGVFGFTLVELIIVITILAILATIAFMSFQGYAKQSRDSNRLTTIKNIEKGVDLFLTKSGKIPAPDEATAFTGGSADNLVKISQGTVGAQMVQVINMNQVPLDPKTQAKYHYSVFGETPYYQIGIEQEQDGVSYISPTFADSEEVMISGNYTFDPSLPSLFVVEDSVVSGGLFGTGVCFVLYGGENTFETENEDCETKTELLEKGFDTSLVGYWDMESLTGGKLRDLSGNGNEGIFTGSILPTLTGGYLGGGFHFSRLGGFYTEKKIEFNKAEKISISMIVNTKIPPSYIGGHEILLELSDDSNSNTGAFYLADHFRDICQSGIDSLISHTRLDVSVPGKTTKGLIKCPMQQSIQNEFKILTFIIDYGDPNNNEIYLNGKIQDVFTHGTHNAIPGPQLMINHWVNNHQLFIGRRSTKYAVQQGTFGIIDEVKIYNRALSDQEILQQAKIAGF